MVSKAVSYLYGKHNMDFETIIIFFYISEDDWPCPIIQMLNLLAEAKERCTFLGLEFSKYVRILHTLLGYSSRQQIQSEWEANKCAVEAMRGFERMTTFDFMVK